MVTVWLQEIASGEVVKYPSYTEAAKALGMSLLAFINRYKAGKECNGYIRTDLSFETGPDEPRVELDHPHYATIDGKEFVAVKCDDKKNCKKCDIFKLDPPLSMIQQPLCFQHNCGTQKIVDVCAKYKCIWKRKMNQKQ